MSDEILLSIKNLKTHFAVGKSIVKAVDGVSFDLKSGKTFAIVGESGSGKSITALSIMGLLPDNLASTERGKILFNNKDLLCFEEKEMRKIRGNNISMIFQEPMTSLNPVYDLSQRIYKKIPIIYADTSSLGVVATRLKGQICENSKMLAYHNELPELNHNEIVGWEIIQKYLNIYI